MIITKFLIETFVHNEDNNDFLRWDGWTPRLAVRAVFTGGGDMMMMVIIVFVFFYFGPLFFLLCFNTDFFVLLMFWFVFEACVIEKVFGLWFCWFQKIGVVFSCKVLIFSTPLAS